MKRVLLVVLILSTGCIRKVPVSSYQQARALPLNREFNNFSSTLQEALFRLTGELFPNAQIGTRYQYVGEDGIAEIRVFIDEKGKPDRTILIRFQANQGRWGVIDVKEIKP